MKLRLLREYRSSKRGYKAGQVIEVTAADAAFLRADSPGTFGGVTELTYNEREDEEKAILAKAAKAKAAKAKAAKAKAAKAKAAKAKAAKDTQKGVSKPPVNKMVEGAEVDK